MMKKLLLLTAFLFTLPAYGQTGARYDGVVMDQTGKPVVGINVRVCTSPASGQPCSPLVTIYSDVNLQFPAANPTTTDFLGNFYFYVPTGTYELEFSGATLTTKQVPDVTITSPASSTGGNVSTSGTPVQFQVAVFSGPTNITGIVPGVSGTCLTSNGLSVLPTFQPCNSITNPSGPLSRGEPVLGLTGGATIYTSPQSIDVTAYGVKGDGVTDDAPALRNAITAACPGGVCTTLAVPAGLNILLNSTVVLPSGTHIVCAGNIGWEADQAAESVHFETAQAIFLFKVGTWGGPLQHDGIQIENCAFRDISASNNTALGAVAVFSTNRNRFVHNNFENFLLPATAAPPAPAISAGSGSVSYWVKVSCINDAGGETLPSNEVTATSGSATLTITGPTATGCPAPMTGWTPYPTTAGSGLEAQQTEAGNCTLNASGTGCALGSNWVGTVNNSGVAGGVNVSTPYFFDSSAGFGVHTNSTGNGGPALDASYNVFDDDFCREVGNCLSFDGGTSSVIHGEYAGNIYSIALNPRQAGKLQILNSWIEPPNGSNGIGCATASSCQITNNKFEPGTGGSNGVTCLVLYNPRNEVLGNTWSKCNVALIQEGANIAPLFSGQNVLDIRSQVSNGTVMIAGGPFPTDIVLSGTENGGIGSFFPKVDVVNNFLFPSSAGCTASLTNMLCYDSTLGNTHVLSGGSDSVINGCPIGLVCVGTTAFPATAVGFQAAVNAAGNGAINIPPGTTVALGSTTINISHQLLIQGYGGPGTGGVSIITCSGSPCFNLTANLGLTFDRIQISGTGNPIFSIPNGGASGQNFIFSNSYFLGTECIQIGNSNPFFIVFNNHFRCTQYDISIGSDTDSEIYNNFFDSTGSITSIQGHLLLQAGAANVQVYRNSFLGTNTTSPDVTIFLIGAGLSANIRIDDGNKFGLEAVNGAPERILLSYSGSGTADLSWCDFSRNFVANGNGAGSVPDYVKLSSTNIALIQDHFDMNDFAGATGTGYIVDGASPSGSFSSALNNTYGAGYFAGVLSDTTAFAKWNTSGPPTISSGFGTSPTIATGTDPSSFSVNVGGGGTASSGVIAFTTGPAVNGWNCQATDITTQSTSVFLTKQTASSTTSATFTNYNTAGSATAWTANDILSVNCSPR